MTFASRHPRILRTALAVLVGCGALSGCAVTPDPPADATDVKTLRVVATVAPVTDIVRQVGGDRIVLDGAIPEGVDSHTFRPEERVAQLLSDADLVFLNGLQLETPVIELARTIGTPSERVVLLGDTVVPTPDQRFDFSFPREGGNPNPHAWMNPVLGRAYARVVAEHLCRFDAADCPAFRANLQVFEDRLRHLDTAMRTAFATIPGSRRLLTYHDAYAYFAAEYGWEIVGAVQPADFGSPTEVEVRRLINQIRQTKVQALFGSDMFPNPVLRRIATATGVRYVTDLSDDDLPGEPGTANHTYIAMLVHNYAMMTESLKGDPTALRSVPTTGVRR